MEGPIGLVGVKGEISVGVSLLGGVKFPEYINLQDEVRSVLRSLFFVRRGFTKLLSYMASCRTRDIWGLTHSGSPEFLSGLLRGTEFDCSQCIWPSISYRYRLLINGLERKRDLPVGYRFLYGLENVGMV